VQVGFSAGARDAPAFDWLRNLPKKTDPALSTDMNCNISAAFTLFWNLCCFWLPDKIISDIDNFMEETNIYLMDGNPRLGKLEGKYEVMIGDVEFEFTNACLAPPAGNVSQNYARFDSFCTSALLSYKLLKGQYTMIHSPINMVFHGPPCETTLITMAMLSTAHNMEFVSPMLQTPSSLLFLQTIMVQAFQCAIHWIIILHIFNMVYHLLHQFVCQKLGKLTKLVS
jgi:hypothetical protein